MGEWREWIRTITGLVIMVGFLQMLLPENSMRSVAKLVMGLVLMLAILQPILSIIYWDWDTQFPLELQEEPAISTANLQKRSEAVIEAGSQPVVGSALSSASKQVEALALMVEGVKDANATVIVSPSGQLERISLTIMVSPSDSVDSSGDARNSVELTRVGNQVLRVISQYYGLSQSQVEITVDIL